MSEIVHKIRNELAEIKKIPADQARNMSSSYYTSPEFLTLEEEHIFRKQWICIGHIGEIPNPGDFYTTELVGEQLLVIRNQNQDVRILSNVCRHRGNILVEGRGNRRKFICAYHAWTYSAEGKLLSASLMDRIEGFDKSKCSLPSYAAEVWRGFIYVNLNGKTDSLYDRLQDLAPHIKNYRMEDRSFVFGEETTWHTNWKCLAENFMEGYHLTPTHAKTLHSITPTSLCKKMPAGEYFTGYWSKYDPDYPDRKPYPPELTAEETRQSPMFWVSPNHVVGLATNTCVYMCLRPQGVDHVGIRWGVLSTAGPEEEASTEYVKLCQAFNAEDKVKLETLQRGLKTRNLKPGYLAPIDYEGTIWDIYQYMARLLASDVDLDS